MLKYLRVILKCGPMLIYSYFSWILKYSRHPEKYDINLRFNRVQKLLRKILLAFKVSYDEYSLDEFYKNDKEGSRLFVANHLSFIDPVLFIALSKRPLTFVAKKESLKMPFVGKIVKALSGEFLDRADLKQQLKVFMKVQKEMSENKNIDWVIFPEGTRNKEKVEEVHEFKYGSFKPAMKNNRPVYVFSLFGTQRVLDSKDKNKKYPISIKLDKIYTSEDYKNITTVELSKLAHEECQKGVTEIAKENKEILLTLNK